MEENTRRGASFGLWLDWPFVFRTFRRWILPMISLAAFLMMATYVVSDLRMKDYCTASALISVVPREFNNNNLSDPTNDSALTRNVNMWNSNTLLKAIKDMDPDVEVDGWLHAESVPSTNLVKLSASANTAQDAFYLLNGAIRNYRKIVSNFDESHLTVVLTDTIKSKVNVVKPNPMKYAVLVFAMILCGGLGILGLWTLVTNVLHNEDQAEALLDISIYESLPKVRKKRGQKAVLITNQDMSLEYLEAIDRMASRIGQHMLKHGKKSLMITSVRENEGKTTIAANLAINLAEKGNKVLLMDMDLRRPSLAKLLDQAEEEGKSCSLALENGLKLSSMVKIREDLGNLHVIFQYETVGDADQFLETTNLQEQIKEVARSYDYVIIDTPPMGPVRDADVVAQRVDNAFLVIREEMNRASLINDVTDQLEEFGSHCIGAAMNHCHWTRRRPQSKKGRTHYSNRYRKEGKR